ncbi:MAG TPA: carbon-nitrogen hydrolase family protein [Clostridiaceae bacterium]|nr:carbon-nitrogen hydrolase family protein [Clostridiaceae bacterium]
MSSKFTFAAYQMDKVNDKEGNLKKAVNAIETAAGNGADIVSLPEMFICPYNSSLFPEYVEEAENSRTLNVISDAASRFGVYVIAGSIPEKSSGKIYNTCFVFDKNGSIIGRHRKLHLFDIDIPGKIVFKESETLTAGDQITVIDTEFCRIGIAICYDIRFPELSRLMALEGAKFIVVPGAFNMTTGPAHWEILGRTRALDNQVYVALISPARNEKASYVAYGNSMVCDPWGSIIAKAGIHEEIIYAQIDLDTVERIRTELPLLKHRREDIYKISKASAE